MTTGAFYGYYNSKEELFAVLPVLVYIAGLMCSHMAAFRIATNSNIARMNEPVQSGGGRQPRCTDAERGHLPPYGKTPDGGTELGTAMTAVIINSSYSKQ